MPQTPYYPPNTNLGTLVTLSAASAGVNSAVQLNNFYRGVLVGIDVTAITGTSPTLTVTIEGVDPVTNTATFTVLASASITTTGYTTLVVYPGVAVTANETASTVLPYNWKVVTAIGGTTPAVTATVTAVAIV